MSRMGQEFIRQAESASLDDAAEVEWLRENLTMLEAAIGIELGELEADRNRCRSPHVRKHYQSRIDRLLNVLRTTGP